jgi:hypothetical protein
VTVLVAAGEVRGQLTPAAPGSVTVLGSDGPLLTSEIDDHGGFAFGYPGAAPLRLRVTAAPRDFVTGWFRPVAR